MKHVVAGFDSASGMLRALGLFLEGKDFRGLGQARRAEPAVRGLLAAAAALPASLTERLYALAGWAEAVPLDSLAKIDAGAVASWVTAHYPERRVPAVFVGSSNGALLHLAAAGGLPWLPQSLLIAVRRGELHPDASSEDLERARDGGLALVRANPELALHHMHDPNQDRLMVRYMTYFRVKRLRLGRAYEDFLAHNLEAGGTIVLVDCRLRWPVTRVAERYFYQHGAYGGLKPDEYEHGSARVADYLGRYGSPVRRWSWPDTHGDEPEAEWGFEEALARDVERFAAERGFTTRRLSFATPDDPSPLVADFHRRWFAQLGRGDRRLLVESFLLLDPFWALRTGSIPYWTTFPVERSRERLERYLDEAGFDEIRLGLFNHGTESAGLAGIDAWRQTLARARKLGVFAGVDPDRFPRDFASFARFNRELRRIRHVEPMPASLPWAEIDSFLAEESGRYGLDYE